MLKVLSLFDGISCGRVALERAGLEVERYVAFEIDQDAINVSNWNYPDIEHRGSVEGADFSEFIGFDIVIGGFPCTDLSIGKNGREGLKGKASRLFWEQVRAIEVVKPKYFLVENNYGMPKKDEAIITETLGVDPIYINSALVSGQNRKRLYWTNIPRVEAPEDRGILLRDVLEENPALKYYHTDGALDYLFAEGVAKSFRTGKLHENDKANTITSVMAKGVPHNVLAVKPLCGQLFNVNPSGAGMNGRTYGVYGKRPTVLTNKGEGTKVSYKVADLAQGAQSGRVYDVNAKSVCLQSGGGGMDANTGLYALAFRTRNTDQGRYKKPEVQLTGKANAITTVQSDSMVIGATRASVPVFLVEAGLLHYKGREVPVKLSDGLYAIRKLTPLECERLQTLPDHYTDMVSDTQRYKQLGNGWTVDVIAHIFNYINLDNIL